MKKISRDRLMLPIIGAALLIGSATSVVTVVSAATSAQDTAQAITAIGGRPSMTPPAAFGTITAISGSNITITDDRAGKSYTVDASNATLSQGPESSTQASISSLKVGDKIAVEGSISGTSITATSIHTGGPHDGFGGRGMGHGVRGTVSAVSGSIVTLTDEDGGTYTVDASSASVRESGATSTIAALKVGDTVMVGGKVTTANMTATQIEDGLPPMSQSWNERSSQQTTSN